MSSNADAPTTKQTFVAWAPDYPDALERRLAMRAQHREGIKRGVAEGHIKYGGPISDPVSGNQNGSMVVLEVESATAARAVIEKDIFWSSNVWDKEKLDIRLITVVANQP